jgi:hypothetical protein
MKTRAVGSALHKNHTPNALGARACSLFAIRVRSVHYDSSSCPCRAGLSQRRSSAGKSFKVAPVSKCSTKIRPMPRVKVAAVAHETAKPIKTLGGIM